MEAEVASWNEQQLKELVTKQNRELNYLRSQLSVPEVSTDDDLIRLTGELQAARQELDSSQMQWAAERHQMEMYNLELRNQLDRTYEGLEDALGKQDIGFVEQQLEALRTGISGLAGMSIKEKPADIHTAQAGQEEQAAGPPTADAHEELMEELRIVKSQSARAERRVKDLTAGLAEARAEIADRDEQLQQAQAALEELKAQQQAQEVALIAAHQKQVAQLTDEYEAKLTACQAVSATATDSFRGVKQVVEPEPIAAQPDIDPQQYAAACATITKLEKENYSLQLQLEKVKREGDQAMARAQELAADLAVAERKAANTAERVAILMEDQARLQTIEEKYQEQVESVMRMEEEEQALVSRITELEQENKDLQMDLEVERTAAEQVQEDYEQLREKLDKMLSKKPEAENKKKMEAQEAELQQLKVSTERLSAEVRHLRDELTNMSNELRLEKNQHAVAKMLVEDLRKHQQMSKKLMKENQRLKQQQGDGMDSSASPAPDVSNPMGDWSPSQEASTTPVPSLTRRQSGTGGRSQPAGAGLFMDMAKEAEVSRPAGRVFSRQMTMPQFRQGSDSSPRVQLPPVWTRRTSNPSSEDSAPPVQLPPREGIQDLENLLYPQGLAGRLRVSQGSIDDSGLRPLVDNENHDPVDTSSAPNVEELSEVAGLIDMMAYGLEVDRLPPHLEPVQRLLKERGQWTAPPDLWAKYCVALDQVARAVKLLKVQVLEVGTSKKSLQDCRCELEVCRGDKLRLQEEVSCLEVNHKQLQSALEAVEAAAEARSTELRNRLTDMEVKLSATEEKLQLSEKSLTAAEAELTPMREKLTTAEACLHQAEETKVDLKTITDQLTVVREKLVDREEELAVARSETARLEVCLKNVNEEVLCLRSDLSAVMTTLASLGDQLGTSLDGTGNEGDLAAGSAASRLLQCAQLFQQKLTGSLQSEQALRQQLSQVQQTLEELQRDKRRILQELGGRDLADILQELSKVTEDKEALMAELEEHMAQYHELEGEHQQVQRTGKTLQAVLQQQQAALSGVACQELELSSLLDEGQVMGGDLGQVVGCYQQEVEQQRDLMTRLQQQTLEVAMEMMEVREELRRKEVASEELMQIIKEKEAVEQVVVDLVQEFEALQKQLMAGGNSGVLCSMSEILTRLQAVKSNLEQTQLEQRRMDDEALVQVPAPIGLIGEEGLGKVMIVLEDPVETGASVGGSLGVENGHINPEVMPEEAPRSKAPPTSELDGLPAVDVGYGQVSHGGDVPAQHDMAAQLTTLVVELVHLQRSLSGVVADIGRLDGTDRGPVVGEMCEAFDEVQGLMRVLTEAVSQQKQPPVREDLAAEEQTVDQHAGQDLGREVTLTQVDDSEGGDEASCPPGNAPDDMVEESAREHGVEDAVLDGERVLEKCVASSQEGTAHPGDGLTKISGDSDLTWQAIISRHVQLASWVVHLLGSINHMLDGPDGRVEGTMLKKVLQTRPGQDHGNEESRDTGSAGQEPAPASMPDAQWKQFHQLVSLADELERGLQKMSGCQQWSVGKESIHWHPNELFTCPDAISTAPPSESLLEMPAEDPHTTAECQRLKDEELVKEHANLWCQLLADSLGPMVSTMQERVSEEGACVDACRHVLELAVQEIQHHQLHFLNVVEDYEEQMGQLKQHMVALKKKLREEQGACRSHQEKASRLEGEFNDRLERLQRINKMKKGEVDELQSKWSATTEELKKLRESHQELLSQADRQSRECSSLRSRLKEAEPLAAVTPELREQLHSAELQLSSLQAEVSVLAKRNSVLQSSLTGANEELTILREEVSQWKQMSLDVDGYQAELVDLRKRLKDAVQEVSVLKEATARAEELQALSSSLQSELARSNKIVTNLEQRLRSVEDEHRDLTIRYDTEMKSHEAASRAWSASLDSLSARAREEWPLSVRRLVEEAERQAVEEVNQKMAFELERSEAEYGDEISRLTRRELEESRKRSLLEGEVHKLSELVATLRTDLQVAERKFTQELTEDREAAAIRESQLKQECKEVEEKLAAARAEVEVRENALKTQHRALVEELSSVRSKVQGMLAEKDDEVESLKLQLKQARMASGMSMRSGLPGRASSSSVPPLPVSSLSSSNMAVPPPPGTGHRHRLSDAGVGAANNRPVNGNDTGEIVPVESPTRAHVVDLQQRLGDLEAQVGQWKSAWEESERTHALREQAEKALKEELAQMRAVVRLSDPSGQHIQYLRSVLVSGFETGELPRESTMFQVLRRLLNFTDDEVEKMKNAQHPKPSIAHSGLASLLHRGGSFTRK